MGKSRPAKVDAVEEARVREAAAPSPKGHAVLRLVVTTLLLVSIAYVAVYLAIGTDGFRSYVAEYLADRLGLPVKIQGSKATLSLNMVLNGIVVSSTDEVSRAEFRVTAAEVDWSFLGRGRGERSMLQRVALRDCALTMELSDDGSWQPAFAARLGDWLSQQCGLKVPKPKAAPVPPSETKDKKGSASAEKRVELDPGQWKSGVFSISDGRITWLNSAGAELGIVEGLSLDITPVMVPHRKLVHYRASIARGRFEDGRQVYNLVYESLKTGKDEILLAFTGEWTTGKAWLDEGDAIE